MNLILTIPLPLRLGFVFLLAAFLAGQLNRAIYQLAYCRRAIGPWSSPKEGVPPRHWLDRLPVVGWWGLRREVAWHGRGYWIRPMLIELATGCGLAALYWLETERGLLWPSIQGDATPSFGVLHAQFLSHAVLIALMIVATFIDFDERIIPDEITVTGTVLGLLFAVGLPASLLPNIFEPPGGIPSLHHQVLTSSTISLHWASGWGGPYSWPHWLDTAPGLGLALVGVWAWCLAIMHKTWTLRYGLARALRYMIASVVRHRTWQAPLILGVLLSSLMVFTWWFGSTRWQSLLSAVVGMCFGGGLIWAVRIIGGHALRTEAMGFGDVTLMAMIGSFVGWQAAFLIFFLAPFTALFIATAQRVLTGDRHIAFGPYLCFSTLLVLMAWDAIWIQWAHPMFSLGWFIPGMLACCLVLFGGLLWFWRMVRDAFF